MQMVLLQHMCNTQKYISYCAQLEFQNHGKSQNYIVTMHSTDCPASNHVSRRHSLQNLLIPGQLCDADVLAHKNSLTAVPMSKGDVLLFDSTLPHGTGVNTTARHRWALQFHYVFENAKRISDATRLKTFGSEGQNVSC